MRGLATPILAFNFFGAITKIQVDAVCYIHVSTALSLIVIYSHKITDFLAIMHPIQFRLGL